ncbi:hypothetical protein BC941DRAFT_485542 [Chlamydoabsidia padenii]|nr:hypothetical protein BC941DRAFT_485542 [Chlamydoabsidia padenii]
MVSLSVPSSSSEVCATPSCIQSAVNILADIDFNVDPCSDFYQYTCGGWLKNATIPDSESSVGNFMKLRDENIHVIEGILTGTYQDAVTSIPSNDEERVADQANFEMIKHFFESCMNEQLVDQLGTQPLSSFLTFIKQEKSLLNMLVRLELSGLANPLISVGVDPDEKNPNQNVVTLMQPSLGLPSKEYFEQDDYLAVYRMTMLKLSKLILPDLDEAAVNRAVDFETQLAKVSFPLEDLQDPLAAYNPITFNVLQERYPILDWHHFFDRLAPGITPAKIILVTPNYFDQLTNLWTETDKQVIINYIILSIARETAHLVNKTTNDVMQDLNMKLTGRTSAPPRLRTCIQRTNDALGDLLGHYFVNRVFSDHEATSFKVQEQLDAIHDLYAKRLETIDWLDDTTRKMALDKIGKMSIKSMYNTISPDIRSPTSLNKYYGALASMIHPETLFENQLAVASWQAKKRWANLNQAVDKNQWFMEPQMVNAYFSPTFNQVVVPAGILQPPFFNIDSDPLSLGGIGVVIGHELTHGFDNSGRLYDGDGFLTQWWSDATKEQFNEKAQCFIDQYNGFSIDGPDGKKHHINGKMTLGENLADNGGISLAYQVLSKSPQLRLPGIDMSPEALFFINFGRVWCEKDRPERAVQKILGDVHSPARVRVNAAVQNMPEFAKTFNCPAGSPMNPTRKCKLW